MTKLQKQHNITILCSQKLVPTDVTRLSVFTEFICFIFLTFDAKSI